MTIPPVIRIFFAVDLPDGLKERLSDYIAVLKKSAKTHGIRWSKPENLHVTLQFIPEAQTNELSRLTEAVRNKLPDDLNCSKIEPGKIQLFPNPFHPRVIVLEMLPQATLLQLSKQIGVGISSLNYELDQRPFNAHLTLGRIKHPKSVDLGFLEKQPPPEGLHIPLDEITLFRSDPLPEGSQYTVLERIPLASCEARPRCSINIK